MSDGARHTFELIVELIQWYRHPLNVLAFVKLLIGLRIALSDLHLHRDNLNNVV